MASDPEKLAHARWVLERNLHWIAAAEVKVGIVIAIDTGLLGALASALSTSSDAVVLCSRTILGRRDRHPRASLRPMGLKEDLNSEVASIFRSPWKEEVTNSVPAAEDLLLNSNHSKKLETAAVLYADIDGSTSMVDQYIWGFSAEVYKAYLRCASQIIKAEGGVITAYDGDRVMGIFMGGTPRTDAVRASLKINWAVTQIIRPAYTRVYPQMSANFVLKHVIGIDISEIHATRIGVHGDNDIVWVGGAANHAAKLCTQTAQPIWITKPVFEQMLKEVRYAKNGVDMWTPYTWQGMSIFGTSYVWAV